ncbi:hypothetical protein G9C98_003782 [Cotesia typhae]|uniref:Thioredoxin domain-containing protein n=1 Tax=Cotesia typhae TaxID=2053667 RepID=A0A8J5QX99_9HYME|nr:hypothetical protein G9C98_003782 [Cotesia typhae]
MTMKKLKSMVLTISLLLFYSRKEYHIFMMVHLHSLHPGTLDEKNDKQNIRILNELENIDDDLEKEEIVMIRIDNAAEAKDYGIDHLPTLVYFEDKIPAIYEGDLLNEDEVLQWLVEQKKTATIEEVTDEILSGLIDEHEYVVVYFSKYFFI